MAGRMFGSKVYPLMLALTMDVSGWVESLALQQHAKWLFLANDEIRPAKYYPDVLVSGSNSRKKKMYFPYLLLKLRL
jgi:hypothetical protein